MCSSSSCRSCSAKPLSAIAGSKKLLKPVSCTPQGLHLLAAFSLARLQADRLEWLGLGVRMPAEGFVTAARPGQAGPDAVAQQLVAAVRRARSSEVQARVQEVRATMAVFSLECQLHCLQGVRRKACWRPELALLITATGQDPASKRVFL